MHFSEGKVMITFLHTETHGLLCVVGIRKKANMTTPTTTPEYMLLFRGMDWDRGLSPEEIQNLMSRWVTWFDRLTEQGKARAGQPLTDNGKVIPARKDRRSWTVLSRSPRKPSLAISCYKWIAWMKRWK